jgi:pheromone shutdown protein TraB
MHKQQHCKYCGRYIAAHELCECRQRAMIRSARQSQDIAELIAQSIREQFLRGSLVAEVAWMEAAQ